MRCTALDQVPTVSHPRTQYSVLGWQQDCQHAKYLIIIRLQRTWVIIRSRSSRLKPRRASASSYDFFKIPDSSQASPHHKPCWPKREERKNYLASPGRTNSLSQSEFLVFLFVCTALNQRRRVSPFSMQDFSEGCAARRINSAFCPATFWNFFFSSSFLRAATQRIFHPCCLNILTHDVALGVSCVIERWNCTPVLALLVLLLLFQGCGHLVLDRTNF